MKKEKIKGIIFDCWGTLFYDDYEIHPFREFCNALESDFDKDYEFMKMFETCFMLKKFEDSKEPVSDILKRKNIPASDANLKKYRAIIDKIGHNQKEYPDVLTCLADYKKDYKLAMITNTYSVSFETLKKKFDLDNLFDCIITSYESKLLKPDSNLFTQALHKLHLKPEEVIMVGDSIKDDFLAAKEIGIKAVLIDRKNKYPSISPRIECMTELKDLL